MKNIEPFDPRDHLFQFDRDRFDQFEWLEPLDDILLLNEEFNKYCRPELEQRNKLNG